MSLPVTKHQLSITRSGFTLIELLIVIAILGALSAAVMFTFRGARSSARDTQRKSDIKQYQTAVEQYANRNNSLYPLRDATNVRVSTTLCADLGLAVCPEEPQSANFYFYRSDGGVSTGAAGAATFYLWVRLEKPPTPVTYFVSCSDGRVGCTTSNPTGWTNACPAPLTAC